MKILWKFPKRWFLRIEYYCTAVIALVVFLIALTQWNNFLWALGATTLFVVLYFVISLLTRLIRRVEEKYLLHPKHLEINRKTRFSQKNEKVVLKEIKRHKLDHHLLGGYILTKKGKKHLLFFNTPKELEKFEETVVKYTQKR